MIVRILFTCFCLLSISQSYASNGKAQVTLLVLVDLSASMDKHRKKLTALAPLVAEAMENTRCEYKVAVGNILYEDAQFNDLTPWGSPAFVTSNTPDSVNLIRQRIENPELAASPYVQPDGTEALPKGDSEKTYSSLVASISHNLAELRGQDVVATLLLTDAAPGFEVTGPSQALEQIHLLLGDSTFVPGTISYPLKEGMNLYNPGSSCNPDFPRASYVGQGVSTTALVNTGVWKSKDILALEKFSRMGGGWNWDICQDEYDNSLREYLNMVMDAAACQLLM